MPAGHGQRVWLLLPGQHGTGYPPAVSQRRKGSTVYVRAGRRVPGGHSRRGIPAGWGRTRSRCAVRVLPGRPADLPNLRRGDVLCPRPYEPPARRRLGMRQGQQGALLAGPWGKPAQGAGKQPLGLPAGGYRGWPGALSRPETRRDHDRVAALAGDYQGVYTALAAFAKEVLHNDVELVESDNPNWGGACSYDQEGRANRIVVAGNRSPLFRAQILAHELAHALLHSDKDYRAHNPRSRIECDDESVSFCIMHHFGLDVGEVAFGYLAHWGDGENAMAELMECGARIRDTAHQVIAWIDEQFAEAASVEGPGVTILQDDVEIGAT